MVSGSTSFLFDDDETEIGFQMVTKWETYPRGLPPMGSSFPLRS
nr:MAG TPA: hypothetical protein [Caudoviricetes sp.]